MQWYCRLVMKNSVLDLMILPLDSLLRETASPRTHKPKIVNESLQVTYFLHVNFFSEKARKTFSSITGRA